MGYGRLPWGIVLGFLVLLGENLGAIANGKASITFEQYYQQCLTEAQKEGVVKAVAQELCRCTIATFKKRYSLKEFNQLVKQAQTNKAVARQLEAVGEDCLFEE